MTITEAVCSPVEVLHKGRVFPECLSLNDQFVILDIEEPRVDGKGFSFTPTGTTHAGINGLNRPVVAFTGDGRIE